MISHIIRSLTLLTIIAFVSVSCSKDSSVDEYPTTSNNVVELAALHSDLSLFVEAARQANIEASFDDNSSYTLFAPTDSSFQAYLDLNGFADVEALRNSMSGEDFRRFVSYHMLDKRVKMENIANGFVTTFAQTKDGDNLHSHMLRMDNHVTINGGDAHIKMANITDGISTIHKIDGVLHPLTLEDIARVNPSYSRLYEAIQFAGADIQTILNEENYHTLFAPTDAAFNTFVNYYGYSDITSLLSLIGSQQVANALKYHLIKGRFKAEDFQTQEYQTLLAGASLHLTKDSSGTILLKDSNADTTLVQIVTTNIVATNGITHTIDAVLEP